MNLWNAIAGAGGAIAGAGLLYLFFHGFQIMGKGQTVRETVLYFTGGGYDIRVWVKPTSTASGMYWELLKFIESNSWRLKRELADLIAAQFPTYVNAVEVKDSNCAELTYNDWP